MKGWVMGVMRVTSEGVGDGVMVVVGDESDE